MTQAHRWLLKWARTLHVYLTLFGFMLLLFFAATGFMLNHEDWFLPQQITTGTIPVELCDPEKRDNLVDRLAKDFSVPGNLESADPAEDGSTLQLAFRYEDAVSGKILVTDVEIRRDDGHTTAKQNRASLRETKRLGKLPVDLFAPEDRSKDLLIVEALRKDFGLRGAITGPPSYETEDGIDKVYVQFKSPGYEAEVRIRTSDGEARIVERSKGLVGVMLDLHRGKESGMAWSVVIDAIAILMVIVSITGFILWTSLKSRAHYGLWILLAGTAVGFAVYFAYVPR